MRRSTLLLRKINGTFGAYWRNGFSLIGAPAGIAAPSMLSIVLAITLLVLPVLALFGLGFALSALGLHAHHSAGLGGLAFAGTLEQEFKDSVEKLGRAFETFKASNDERLKEIEKKGVASADVLANVEKANAAVTAMTKQVSEIQDQIRELENANARHNLRGTREETDRTLAHARQFMALVTSKDPATIEVSAADVEKYTQYRAALNTYFRRGDASSADVKAALQTGSAPDGGFWLTPDTSGRIIELIFQSSPMRAAGAAVQPIGTDRFEGFTDLDEADSGWVSEMGARNETSTPQTGKYAIDVFEQYANPRTTQKNLDDSLFDVEAWLAKKVSSKLTRRENTGFVSGNGVGKPRGFLTYPDTGKPAKGNWQSIQQIHTGAANGFVAVGGGASPADCFIDLITSVKPEYRAGAAFAMNTLTVATIRKFKDGQGNYLFAPPYINGANVGFGGGLGNPPTTGIGLGSAGLLFGYPIYEFADMPDVAANALPIAFARWSEAYQILDHVVGMRVLRDPFTDKPYIRFYTTKRVGGDVVNFEAIKLMKVAA